MNPHLSRQHLSAETLQALLEGQLAARERGPAEEHLAACAHCAGELELWRTLFQDLSQLPVLAPSATFSEKILAGVRVREPLSLAARARAWLGAGGHAAHPTDERLQDFVDGTLPVRQAARVRTHLEGCPGCSGQAAAWRAAFAHLDGLEPLALSDGFAARVMAQVRIPAPAPARVPEWRRALAWVGGLVPQTRQAWAAISGVALTPAVTLGLVFWTLFSHPTLTPGALAYFAWWKATEFAGLAWKTFTAAAMESSGLFEIYSFFGSLVVSPAAVAGSFIALSLGTLAASWVLYRNLFAPHPQDGRIAHASLS